MTAPFAPSGQPDPLEDPNWGHNTNGHDPDPPFENLGGTPDDGRRRLRLTPASRYRRRRARWLWDDRWPLGSLGLLAGYEGEGKSTIAADIAGAVTRGTLPGEFHGTPRSVMIVASEDSWTYTIANRLLASGADLDRIYHIEAVDHPEGMDLGLSLPVDTIALQEAAIEHDVALLILDPLISRLSEKLDTYKDSEVRRALEPVVAAAEAANLHISGLIHFNKATDRGEILDRMMGSRAFTAVARSVSVVTTDPNELDGGGRLFGVVKSNLGSGGTTLGYRIGSVEVPTDDGPTQVGKIQWTGEKDLTIRDALAAKAADAQDNSMTTESVQWLEAYWEATGTVIDAAEAIREAGKVGIEKRTLQRARERLGLESVTTRTAPPRRKWRRPRGDQ